MKKKDEERKTEFKTMEAMLTYFGETITAKTDGDIVRFSQTLDHDGIKFTLRDGRSLIFMHDGTLILHDPELSPTSMAVDLTQGKG